MLTCRWKGLYSLSHVAGELGWDIPRVFPDFHVPVPPFAAAHSKSSEAPGPCLTLCRHIPAGKAARGLFQGTPRDSPQSYTPALPAPPAFRVCSRESPARSCWRGAAGGPGATIEAAGRDRAPPRAPPSRGRSGRAPGSGGGAAPWRGRR